MYVFGGKLTVSQYPKLNKSLYKLDLTTREWSIVTSFPDTFVEKTERTQQSTLPSTMRSTHQSAFVLSESEEDETFLFTPDHPLPRSEACAVVCQNHLFLFGGLGVDQELNDLWMFDPQSVRWICCFTKGICPAPRFVSLSALCLHFFASIGFLLLPSCIKTNSSFMEGGPC